MMIIFKEKIQMKIIKKFAVFAAATMLTSAAWALEYIHMGPPGGGSGTIADMFAASASNHGTSMTSRHTGNCATGTALYQTIRDPIIAGGSSMNNTTEGCRIPVTKDNLIAAVRTFPLALCHKKDHPVASKAHFFSKQPKKTAVAWSAVKHMEYLSKEVMNNSENHTIVSVGNSAGVRKASLGNEFEYFLFDSTYAYSQRDQFTCLFSISETPISGMESLPTLKSLYPKANYTSTRAVLYVISKNLNPADLDKMRKLYDEKISMDPKFREAVFAPGQEPLLKFKTVEEEVRFVNRLEEEYSRFSVTEKK